MRVVVALGGNAILRRGDRGTIPEQRAAIRDAAEDLARIAADGHELIVTHGNGPQVGRLMLQEEALPDQLPRYPLDVHVAETQGQLGYLIQQELSAALRRARVVRTVVTLITQVEVDVADPAFENPTKPVGPYLSKKGMAEYRARGIPVAEAGGGGWRRVVPSPLPIGVVEADAIGVLLAAGVVPVAAGGGGVPVVREGNGFRGVAAVVDKDLTSSVLARALSADALLILTDVEQVQRRFGTPDAEPIVEMTADDAEKGVDAGDFPAGSMGEKVLAAAAAARAGIHAVIGPLGGGYRALAGDTGTLVTDARP